MTESTIDPLDPPRRPRRGLWIGLGATAVLLLGGYAAAVATVSGEVPAGTSVLGVPIGGMSAERAAATLEEELGAAARKKVPVTAGESSMELDPKAAGLAVDWAATAEQASGVILNPAAVLAHLRGDVALLPVTTVDESALTEQLEALALTVDTPATEPQITFTSAPAAKLTPGTDGAALDVPGAADAVAEKYFQSRDVSIALPVQAVPPTVTAESADEALTGIAKPAIARPVTLVVGDEEVTITGKDLAATLAFEVEDGALAPALDGVALHKRIADDLGPLERPGRSATFRIVNNRPQIVPSRPGRAVDAGDMAEAVLAVLPETTAAERVATVAVTSSEPDLTTEEAKALKITEKLSSFRQWFPPAPYRYTNVGQAARYLNGTILEPGEVFSMNGTIKERTVANGYTTGTIIQGGRFREELGGGVSIITTATWTAGFYAGLERIEQHAHGLYISRYTAGLEATVAWGLLDLRMRNNTGNGVLITATRYNDGVLIEMWGTRQYDRVTATFSPRRNYTGYTTIYDDDSDCVPSEGSQGFTISVTRRLIRDGRVVKAETWPTVYKPTPNVVCGPRPGAGGDDTAPATQ